MDSGTAQESVAGDLLRRARRRRGLSQRELAFAAAVPASTVGRIEAALRQPTVPMLLRLLAAAELAPTLELRSLTATDGGTGTAPATSGWSAPVEVPADLAQLRGPTSGIVHLPGMVYGSGAGPRRGFNLDDDGERVEFYEIVLANGTASQIAEYLDVNELIRLWPSLWLPPHVQRAWASSIPFPCRASR